MPTHRSINVSLHSQFDIEIVPEYYPPPHLISPAVAPLVEDNTSTCNVFVPVLPGSQFWIVYSVSPPVPEGQFFLFKLYVDGEKLFSWAVGKEDGWRGKCMFGLFESEGLGGKRVEKRVLCFNALNKGNDDGNVENKEGCVEIRVHRASGRKRIEREMRVFEETALAKNNGGISLVNAGRAGPEQPKRFYKFALIDPVDRPFATFRYHYRTWDQLRDLELMDFEYYAESEENDLSVIEPSECPTHGRQYAETQKAVDAGFKNISKVDTDGISIRDWNVEQQSSDEKKAIGTFSIPVSRTFYAEQSPPHRDINASASGTYVLHGTPALDSTTTGGVPSLRRRRNLDTYRLSMPPSIKFTAPEEMSQPLPLPQKHDDLSSTAYRPHPAYPVDDWTVQTPSPAESV
ncbi:hypothetical protein N0V94_003849 [Neodidymelliopsis sp. IMI 364377]|nr:hypothetical protein N0V94_003849 [Neodidymelliopsis sp. IMI 364377]